MLRKDEVAGPGSHDSKAAEPVLLAAAQSSLQGQELHKGAVLSQDAKPRK